MRKILVIIGLTLFVSACTFNNEEELYGLDCDLVNITYASHIDSIMQTSCATTNCHAANTNNPEYTSYNLLRVDSGKIFERVLIQKNMPPGRPLSDCEFKQIEAWFQQGFKE